MKRPIITIAAIDVRCPDCGEFIASEGGPLYFEIGEVRSGERHDCLCGYSFTFPNKIILRQGIHPPRWR